jgi:hypothetical protein
MDKRSICVVVFLALALGGCAARDVVAIPIANNLDTGESTVRPDTTITYAIDGTLGPVLSGGDPLGANGQSETFTLSISSTLSPIHTTHTSATYRVAKGLAVFGVGGSTYKSNGPGTVKYIFPHTGADLMVVSAPARVSGITVSFVVTASLANGSFSPTKIRVHPTLFAPSPQTLHRAHSATGPGSKEKYTAPLVGTTILGLKGTASN